MALLHLYIKILLVVFITGPVCHAAAKSIDDSDQLDEQDRQEFNARIDRANACTSSRDFICAEQQLGQAKHYVNGSRDRSVLQRAMESLEVQRQLAIRDDAKRKYSAERSTVQANADNAEKELAESRRINIENALAENRRTEVERERQSSHAASESIGAYILQKGAENSALLNRIDRQTNAAYAETNRRLAAQAAERERARAERDEREAERRRDAAREREARERAAREEADRAARVRVAAAQEKPFSTYSQPQVVIESTRQTCPPGSKPAGWTTPSTAVCLKDPQSTAGQGASGQGSDGNSGGSTASGSAAGRTPSTNARNQANNGGGSASGSTTGRTSTTNTRNRANEDTLASNTRRGEMNGASSSDTTAQPPSPVTSGNSSTNNSRAPITNDPDPYANDQFNWTRTGSGSATTRQAACSKARAQTEVEIARLKAVEVNTTEISPCVCFDNDKFYAGQAATVSCRVYIQTKDVSSGPPKSVAR